MICRFDQHNHRSTSADVSQVVQSSALHSSTATFCLIWGFLFPKEHRTKTKMSDAIHRLVASSGWSAGEYGHTSIAYERNHRSDWSVQLVLRSQWRTGSETQPFKGLSELKIRRYHSILSCSDIEQSCFRHHRLFRPDSDLPGLCKEHVEEWFKQISRIWPQWIFVIFNCSLQKQIQKLPLQVLS